MEDFSIKSLNEFICKSKGIHLDSWDSKDIDTPFEIKPKQFLKFAERDLNNELEHHLVNALSNIKRSIDCQLDSLLCGFGLFDYSKKKRWNFPTKVVQLNKLGLISPRILDKINKKRNLLEHDYKNPKKEDVEDALDVATLFIAYTEKFLFSAITECSPASDIEYSHLEVKLNYKEGEIVFYELESKNNKLIQNIKKKVSSDSDEYIAYLKWFIGLYKLK